VCQSVEVVSTWLSASSLLVETPMHYGSPTSLSYSFLPDPNPNEPTSDMNLSLLRITSELM
jgi:hypothetical protein